MKKIKSLFRSLFIVVFIFFLFMVMAGITTPANNEELVRMNQEIETLENRLRTMEDQLQTVNSINNELYSQILGVDFDTTDIFVYRNDSAKMVFSVYDSIFNALDERMIYAAEMLALELRRVEETSTLFRNNKNAINYYPNISPIKTKDFIELSSPFGWRKHPITGEYLFHEGVDISAYPGTEIYATAQGKVVQVMYSQYGYGNRVVIQHTYGFETLYAHMGTINVKKGQWIRKNQIIGTVGNTGLSTGPHLHYEIRKNNEFRDPLGYFYTHITEEFLAMKNDKSSEIDGDKLLAMQ